MELGWRNTTPRQHIAMVSTAKQQLIQQLVGAISLLLVCLE